MQRIGKMLALATDTPRNLLLECYTRCVVDPQIQQCVDQCDQTINYEPASSPSLVMFFDVSDPVHPAYRSQFVPVDENCGRFRQ